MAKLNSIINEFAMKSFGIQIVAALGNVQVYFMTVLYTRWRFNTEHETNFAYPSKIMKKFVELCLHSSYAVQNSILYSDEKNFP